MNRYIVTLMAAMLFAGMAAAQDSGKEGGVEISGMYKVPKEPKEVKRKTPRKEPMRFGIGFEFGPSFVSGSEGDFDIVNPLGRAGLNLFLTKGLGSNPYPRWVGEFGLAVSYQGGYIEGRYQYFYNGYYNYSWTDDDLGILNVALSAKFRFIFNPMSARGKWYWYGGPKIIPVSIGKKWADEPSSEKLLDSAFHFGLGLGTGLGIDGRHVGLQVGASLCAFPGVDIGSGIYNYDVRLYFTF